MNESPIRLEGFGPQDLYQRREKIFTRAVSGFYQRLRLVTGWPLLLGYFCLPWLMFDERQAVLFDLPARAFHIFGLTIWPQDLWLLGWLLMISAFAMFTLTTIVGRLWCGYTCPQTVWTAIFMWIEQVTEGPRHLRVRLDAAPWSLRKLRKRIQKHGMWLVVAFLTGLTFVGYFTPIRELVVDLALVRLSNIDESIAPIFWISLFTLGTYFNAGWLREQVCIYMCPYARFQSSMIDADTLNVSYDANRGEPRGSRKRLSAKTASGQGDCIDCQLCVQVCPTGIDIRDGLQYECIGCAHCIDACNQVMGQMGSRQGLIRYTSERALGGGKLRTLRPRSIGYAAITALLCAVFSWALFNRPTLALDIIRERDSLYQLQPNGHVRNEYQLIVMNKAQRPQTVSLMIFGEPDITLESTNKFEVQSGSIDNLPLRLSSNATAKRLTNITLRICNQTSGECATENTSFFAPGTNHSAEIAR